MDRMNSTVESNCLFIHPSRPNCTMDRMNSTTESNCLFIRYPTVHPVLLYHGHDGQYNRIQLSIYSLSYCPSRPIVPWTGWTVQWNPTVYLFIILLSIPSYCTMDRMDSTMESNCLFIHYPTVHPVLLYHGHDGQYNGIQLSIYTSISSYCTMDRMNSTVESNCLFVLSILSYCTMDRMNGTTESNCLFIRYPTVHPVLLYHGHDGQYNGIQLSIYSLSYCQSCPIVPWTVQWKMMDNWTLTV